MKRPFTLALGAAALCGCTIVPFVSTTHADRPTTDEPASTSGPGPQTLPDLSAYRLGVADRIKIDVFGEPDLSVEVVIDGTGHFSYPLLGGILALGKTARQIQDNITEGLANGYLVNPDVRVIITQYRPFYVIGQIRKAGAYSYVIGLTVEKALALAGGLTNLASTRKIYLLHEDSPDGRRVRASLDTPVFPGDTVMVEEGLF